MQVPTAAATVLLQVCHMKEPAAEGFGTQCIDGGQQIAQLAVWDESAHTTIGNDYTYHSGLSTDECRAKCLAQKGCEGGVAHQGDQCRIPNNPRDLQGIVTGLSQRHLNCLNIA